MKKQSKTAILLEMQVGESKDFKNGKDYNRFKVAMNALKRNNDGEWKSISQGVTAEFFTIQRVK